MAFNWDNPEWARRFQRTRFYTTDQLDKFERELNQICSTMTFEDVVMVQKKITFEAFIRLVMKTPVDYGFARGGWHITVGVESNSEPSGEGSYDIGRGLSPDAVFSEELTKLTHLDRLKNFQVVYISNNVPYILVLDQGLFDPPNPGPSRDRRPHRQGRVLVRDGFSVQSPQGMVDITIHEIITGGII